ncbi:hypothetical protein MF406_14210 [Georgenia sp. TF02-10]|uniref:hypothetical protein n=1 Tax=Georgenia sp. TF02-10 TaxID=2917725 RepID=UPI001FA6F159|nr:hypothetical protein [Georgenia sp. TF02-10]UNX54086.1 hypothetical protein MF406_14210 [Georgenia sp. TF02-10]
MGRFVEPRDLAPYADIPEAKALAMIEDAEAEAILAAPCITALAPEDPKRDAIRALLRQAIPRRHGADTRVVTQVGAGPFQKSVEPQRGDGAPKGSFFWPSEVKRLQILCASSGAYTVDMTGLSSTSTNPLAGVVVNATPGHEPQGQRSPETLPVSGEVP